MCYSSPQIFNLWQNLKKNYQQYLYIMILSYNVVYDMNMS